MNTARFTLRTAQRSAVRPRFFSSASSASGVSKEDFLAQATQIKDYAFRTYIFSSFLRPALTRNRPGSYVVRRVDEDFASGSELILGSEPLQALETLKRQVIVNNLYRQSDSVMDHVEKK